MEKPVFMSAERRRYLEGHETQRAKSKARRAQAVELRKAGLSYQKIGEAMGVTKNTAWVYVMRALYHGEAPPDLR